MPDLTATTHDERAQPWKKFMAKQLSNVTADKGERDVVRDPEARRQALGRSLTA